MANPNPEIKERLLKFINAMGVSVAQFERNAQVSNGYIRNFNGNFGGNKLDKILAAYPMLNRVWLTTGEGSMILEGVSKQIPSDAGDDGFDEPCAIKPPPTQAEINAQLDRDCVEMGISDNEQSLRVALFGAQKQVTMLIKQNTLLTNIITKLTSTK